jgi:chromosome segregation ATPase
LLDEANEALDYFDSMKELGQLDDEDLSKLEELKKSVSILEDRKNEIDRKIEKISKNPEVNERLQETARQMDKTRTIEMSRAEFEPQIDELAKEIKELASQRNSLKSPIDYKRTKLSDAWDEIGVIFGNAENMLKSGSSTEVKLKEIFNEKHSPREIIRKLTEEKESLGLFKKREKEAIDYILQHVGMLDSYETILGEIENLTNKIKTIDENEENLAEKVKEVFEKAWDKENKTPELDGDLPPYLYGRLQKKIEGFADIKSFDDENRGQGKYSGRFEAERGNPANEVLFDTMKRVFEKSNAEEISMNNPAKKLEQKSQQVDNQ